MKQFLFLIGALCFGSCLAQASTNVAMRTVPNEPIVITGDLQAGKTVKAPWFAFQLQMTNASTQPLTIVAVTVNVSDVSSSWQHVVSFAPSDSDYATQNDRCTYDTSYDVIPPDGKPHMLTVTYQGTDSNCLSSITPTMYVGNNMPSKNNQYNYTVMVQPQGWYGTATNPGERFDQVIVTHTR